MDTPFGRPAGKGEIWLSPGWVVYCLPRGGSYVVDGNFERHHHRPRWAEICIIVPEIMQRANYDYSCCSN